MTDFIIIQAVILFFLYISIDHLRYGKLSVYTYLLALLTGKKSLFAKDQQAEYRFAEYKKEDDSDLNDN